MSIVTVNYGSAEKIKCLFASLKKFPPKGDFEFIIIDNASPRNEGKKLFQFFRKEKNVKVIRLEKNVGFGGGNEVGIKKAHGKFLAIVNPDIEVAEHCFDRLFQALEKEEKAGIVVPQLLNPDQTPQPNTRKFPSFWGLLAHRIFGLESASRHYLQDGENKSKDIIPVEWAQGSFLVMKKSFFTDELGGFDPRFFLFLEDTDLCRRTWELGRKVLKIKKATAFHGTERLSGGNFFVAIQKKTFWIHLSSALKYFWKYLCKKKPEIF